MQSRSFSDTAACCRAAGTRHRLATEGCRGDRELGGRSSRSSRTRCRSSPATGGRHDPPRTRVDLAPLIEAEIPAFPRPSTEYRHPMIDDAPSAAVNGDATLLRQALNAVMFTQRRELLTTNELCVAIDRVAGGDQRTIRVTISGADRLAEVRRLPPSQLEPLVEVRGASVQTVHCAARDRVPWRPQSLEDGAGRTAEAQPTLVGAVLILPEG